jgi:hypothetical protein
MTSLNVRSRAILCMEQLETRDAPATLVGANKVTYQDADGDNVAVTFSKPILNAGNVNSVFTFGSGNVNGSNAVKQQLRVVDLVGVAGAAGTAITTSAVRSPVTGGDGFAALGQIDATGIDLGAVTIDGDLGRVLAGDATTATTGLAGLTALSLGRFGTSTGAADLHTVVQGKLGNLTVKSDVKEAWVEAKGGPDGRIGAVSIGGSLLGGTASPSGCIASSGAMGTVRITGNVEGGAGGAAGQIASFSTLAGVIIGGSVIGGAGTSSGTIASIGPMGTVRIIGHVQGGGGSDSGVIRSSSTLAGVTVGGALIGGAGSSSGRIASTGAMGTVRITGNVQGGGVSDSGEIVSSSTLAGVTIGGSLLGGAGNSSGRIESTGAMGTVRITGNVQGGGGDASGEIFSNSTLAGVTIGGSLLGGAGNSSGIVFSTGAMGTVRITGDVQGGGVTDSGEIFSFSTLAGMTIGGSLLGGAGFDSGRIASSGAMGTVRITGDLVGGSASGAVSLSRSGSIQAQHIAGLTIGGALIAGTDNTSGTFRDNGAIRVADDIGTVLIKGSIIGNATNPAIISARGKAIPTATSDVAIGSLRVLGRVEFATILAGVDVNGVAKNADAQIGPVFVGGDWIASSIAAGALPINAFFGDADDFKMSGGGVKDVATVSSRIASLTITGQALGTVGGADHFGIVAENVGAVKIGGTPLVLTLGNGNDDFLMGITGDFNVNEI